MGMVPIIPTMKRTNTMRVYVIEVLVNSDYSPDVHETMLDLIRTSAHMLNVQAELINRSPIPPTIEAHWMDTTSLEGNQEIDLTMPVEE